MNQKAMGDHDKAFALKGMVRTAIAARVLGINAATINRWVVEKTVESMTVGRANYVLWRSVVVRFGVAPAKILGCFPDRLPALRA